MTKKDYIFNMSNLIKNRVLYHAPINYDGDIDFQKILSLGIDLSLPVFIMQKPMKKGLLKSFVNAQKEVDFNLILREKNKKVQRKIKRCYVVKTGELKGLEKLNINYKRCSKYHRIEKGNFLRIGNVLSDYDEREFYLEKKGIFNGVFFTVKKFLLNGENIMIELSNTTKKDSCVEVEYNHELERGYYSFQKLKKGVKITNLFSNKQEFFNAGFGKIEERYSCVDGVENSTFARINFKANIFLRPFEKRCFFLNYGDKYFSLNNKNEMTDFFEASRHKNFEIFDVKINSKNKFFERMFNHVLPLKIWKAWIEGRRDVESENKYIEIKNNIVLRNKKTSILQNNNYKISDVLLYNGKSYKKIAAS